MHIPTTFNEMARLGASDTQPPCQGAPRGSTRGPSKPTPLCPPLESWLRLWGDALGTHQRRRSKQIMSHENESVAQEDSSLVASTTSLSSGIWGNSTSTVAPVSRTFELASIIESLGQSLPLPPLRQARDAFEKAYLVETLTRTGGNVAAAARASGRNRTDFYELLRRHGLTPGQFKKTT